MPVKFAAITPHLNERYAGYLSASVEKLEAAIASGMVPNVLFKDAKDTFSRVVDQSVESFLKTGPHLKGRDGQPHHQSDWWLGAYHNNAFASGTHSLPAALKRANKSGSLPEYAAFLNELLPLRELLEKAKPLVKKKGEMPKVKTAKQIADEADQMTCQCCRRGIFAATGRIAHHGYERPGGGYQTPSCMGARELPFEVDRSALGRMIEYLKDRLVVAEEHRAAIKDEVLPIAFNYERQLIGPTRYQSFGYHVKWPVLKLSFDVSRESFEAFKKKFGSESYDFDNYKKRHVAGLTQSIENLKAYIKEEQARYDGWKPTHKREGDQWVAL